MDLVKVTGLMDRYECILSLYGKGSRQEKAFLADHSDDIDVAQALLWTRTVTGNPAPRQGFWVSLLQRVDKEELPIFLFMLTFLALPVLVTGIILVTNILCGNPMHVGDK